MDDILRSYDTREDLPKGRMHVVQEDQENTFCEEELPLMVILMKNWNSIKNQRA